MPIYEYRCEACGQEFEELQKISDPPLSVCRKCGKPELRRLISKTSFQLKGGGWYKDLYSSSSSGGKKNPEGGDKSGQDGVKDTKNVSSTPKSSTSSPSGAGKDSSSSGASTKAS